MKLNYSQLPLHLKKNLLSVYLISGDEYLLIQESRDLIRHHAKAQGFTDIERFETQKDFDWNLPLEATQSLSLFSEKTYIEIKLIQSPTASAAKLFLQFLEKIDQDQLVVIISEKLDASAQKSNWYLALTKKGAHLAIWPLDLAKRQAWIKKRLADHQLQCQEAAIQFLDAQTEGNLLACAQEINKLALLFKGCISLEEMREVIGDSACFDLFQLTDVLLEGNAKKGLRILTKLQEQATDPILILWALMREVRLLLTVKSKLKSQPSDFETICRNHQIWDKKKPLVNKAINRLTIEDLNQQLLEGGKVDRIIKGMAQGNSWQALQTIVLRFCGPFCL